MKVSKGSSIVQGSWTVRTLQDLRTAKEIIVNPHAFFQLARHTGSANDTLRYYVVLSIILAILTPVANAMGFPSDVIHASTNAQMTAYKYAHVLEQDVGAWWYPITGVLTLVFMLLKLPLFVAFYHLFARLLGGRGRLLESLKLTVFSATPAMAFGWVPYSDFLFGLWAGLLAVPGFYYLHDVRWGRATAFASFLLGLQILYVVLSGGGWLIEP